ncbi:MAG TPA: CYTH domain-containing protein [Acidimicrobiia bacterium]
MAEEIERKFLVAGDEWRRLAVSSQMLRQGYLSTVKERTVRVRIVDDEGFLTVKGITVGATRAEFEYPIPGDDAAAMLDDLCERPLVEKTRHLVEHEGLTWEIDEFAGVNAGLIVAEVELEADDQDVPLPPWVGAEVTADPRYFNANLIAHPYSEW